MRKFSVSTLLVILSCQFTMAQYEYIYDPNYTVALAERMPIIYQPAIDVNQITYTITKPKTGKTKVAKKQYDGNMNMIAYYWASKKVDKHDYLNITYDKYNNIRSHEDYRNGLLKRSNIYTYKDSIRIESHVKRNTNNKIVSKNTWKYQADGCLSASAQYKRDGEKIRRRWAYSYYKNCEKSRSTLYNGKGKVLNEWTYDCKKEGELLEKKKNQTQVCQWEETGKDTLVKYYEYLDEKGRTNRHVNKYTRKDTLILEHLYFNHKGRLTFKSTYDKSYQKILSTTFYNRRKAIDEFSYTYRGELLLSWTSVRRGKLWSQTQYTYDDQKLLTKYEQKNKRGKLTKAVTLEYIR